MEVNFCPAGGVFPFRHLEKNGFTEIEEFSFVGFKS